MKKFLQLYLVLIFISSQINYKILAEELSLSSNHVLNSNSHNSINLNTSAHEALNNSFSIINYNPSHEIASILNSLVSHEIDLTSTLHDINTGLLNHSLSIMLENTPTQVTSNQYVTPAESIAISQVLSTGHQNISLNNLGVAYGGSLNASMLGNSINNFVVPANITLIDNSHSLTLSGNLANYGDIQFNTISTLSAKAIFNGPGSEIYGNNNLTINTNQGLINEGRIDSFNTLSINAPLIYNASNIEAVNGNLNIASSNNLVITSSVNNANFEAVNGSINLSSGYSNSSVNNTNSQSILNGNFLSRDLNLNAGANGYINAVTDNISGSINTYANSIHMASSSNDMILGPTNLLGDPTYVNTTGSITINGAIATGGGSIAIIANNNINVAAGTSSSISTSVNTSFGSGNVIMIAGAGSNISYTGTSTTTTIPGTSIGSTETVSVTLGTNSGNAGGNIDLVTGNTLGNGSAVISTSAVTGGNAGNVTLVAISAGGSNGQVLLANGTNNYGIYAQELSVGGGANGNVTIISSAINPSGSTVNGIDVGVINNNGGGGTTGGSVGLYNTIPNSSTVTFDSNGNITAGTITPNTTSNLQANIQLNGTINAGSNISLYTGWNINAGSNLLSTANTLSITAGSGSFNSFTAPLTTNAAVLDLSILQTSNFYINDSATQLTLASVSFAGSTSSETFWVYTPNGSIVVNSSFVVGNPTTGSGNVYLLAGTSGNITTSTSSDTIQTGTLLLSIGDNIGSSNSSPLYVIAPALFINQTSSSTGNVYINDSTAVNLASVSISNNNANFYLNSTGSITLGSAIDLSGSTSSVTLIAGNSGITQGSSTDLITANSLILTTINGDIGLSNSSPLFINAASLSLSSNNGNAYLSDSASLTTINNAFFSGTSNAINLVMTNTTSGSIEINTNTAGYFYNLTASGSGTIETGTSGVLSAATAVTLNAGSGLIGNSTSSELLVNSPSITISTNSSAFLLSEVNTTINASTFGSGGQFYLTNSPGTSVTIGGNITIAGSSGLIDLNLIGNSSITSSSSSDVLSANTITLATAGNIGVSGASPVYINCNALNASASGTGSLIYLSDAASSTTINQGSVGSAGTFELAMTNSTAGSIINNSTLVAGNSSNPGEINLFASGSGNITNGSLGSITASTVSLGFGSGNIGTSISSPLVISAGTVFANTTGNVYVSDTQALYLGDSSGNNFYLSVAAGGAGGGINITGALTANTINISTSNSGSIVISNVISSPIGGINPSVTLNANGSGNITFLAGSSSPNIATSTLTLVSGSGNIGRTGTTTNNIVTDALNVSANTTGVVGIIDTSTTGVVIGSSVASSYNLNASGAGAQVYVNNPIEANTIFINASSNGGIRLDNTLSGVGSGVNATSVTLEASGTGFITSIINNTNPTQILANTLVLIAGSGDIGSPTSSITSAITTNATSLSANTSGNAYLSDFTANTVTLNASTSNTFNLNLSNLAGDVLINGILASSTLNLTTAGGSIVVDNPVNTANINLTTAGAGAITVNSTLGTATSNINIVAGGYLLTGAIGSVNGYIVGNSAILTSNNGEIGYNGNGLLTKLNTVTFNAPLSVGINNTSANLNILTSSTKANLYIYQSGNITQTGTITAPVAGLYSFTGTAGIGSASQLIQINSPDVAFESFGTGGSVYVNDTYSGNTTLQQSQASLNAGASGTGGVFKLDVTGSLTIYAQINQGSVVTPGQISGQIIAIQAFNNSSGFGIYNDGNINSNDFIFLTSSQATYIAQAPNNSLMNAPNIALVTGGGAIGAGSQLLLNSGKVAASTSSNNGFVNIYDEASNSGIIGGQSGTNFTFNTNGNINIYGSIATGASGNGGNINISGNGAINIGTSSGISLMTNNGSIVFQNNNATAGSFNIANGSIIDAKSATNAAGYVVLNIGAYKATNTTNPSPSNITVLNSGGANVYFGTNGITATSSGNVLNAQGQDIVFNTGNLLAAAISLNGNVKITADPPVLAFNNAANSVNNLNNSNNFITSLANNLNNSNSFIASLANSVNNSTNFNAIINANTNFGASDLFSSLNTNIKLNSVTSNQNYFSNSNANASVIQPIAYTSTNLIMNKVDINNGSINNNIKDGLNLLTTAQNCNYNLGHNIKLNLHKGAIVLAVKTNTSISIYNLHDNSAKSVVCELANNSITIEPGRCLILSKGASNFATINPFELTGYRMLENTKINNYSIYKADYSILSLIAGLKPLKVMLSDNNLNNQKLLNKILKTASIIHSTTAHKGSYSRITKPSLTALK